MQPTAGPWTMNTPLPDASHEMLRVAAAAAIEDLDATKADTSDLFAIVTGQQQLITSLQSVADQLARIVTDANLTHSDLAAATKAVADQLTAETTRALNAEQALAARKVTIATGTATLGLLAIGSRDVTLTWDRNLGDANYQIDLLPSAVLLGAITATVKTTYATSAIITVKNTALIAAGGALAAIAWRYQ